MPHSLAAPLLCSLQGPWRRVIFVASYEAIAIAVSALGFMWVTGQGAVHSGVISLVCSVIAIVWNVLFNTLFERWERRQRVRGRSLARRVAHAMGFEAGLSLVLVPLLAWWFGVGLWQALAMDFGLLLFFLAYTFVFTWVFDHLFGLPAAAR